MHKHLSILLLILVFIPFGLYAQGIDFFEGTWKEALEKAEKEEKPIFLDAYASWCGPCKLMARRIFTQKQVGDYYNSHFINMQIDMEKGIGPKLARKYMVRSYPTLLFISSDGTVIYKSIGSRGADKFIQLGTKAYNMYDKNSLYVVAYEEGKRDFETLYGYMLSLRKNNKSTIKIANEYLRSNPNLTDLQRKKFIFAAASEADSRLYKMAISNKSDLIDLFGREKYEKWMIEAVLNTVRKAVKFQYDPLRTDAIATIPEFSYKNTDRYIARADMLYYSLMNNRDKYLGAVKSYYNESDKKSLKAQLEFAEEILNNLNDAETRELAISYVKEAIQSTDDVSTILKAAELCVECESYNIALKILQSAIKADEKVVDSKQYKILKKRAESARG